MGGALYGELLDVVVGQSAATLTVNAAVSWAWSDVTTSWQSLSSQHIVTCLQQTTCHQTDTSGHLRAWQGTLGQGRGSTLTPHKHPVVISIFSHTSFSVSYAAVNTCRSRVCLTQCHLHIHCQPVTCRTPPPPSIAPLPTQQDLPCPDDSVTWMQPAFHGFLTDTSSSSKLTVVLPRAASSLSEAALDVSANRMYSGDLEEFTTSPSIITSTISEPGVSNIGSSRMRSCKTINQYKHLEWIALQGQHHAVCPGMPMPSRAITNEKTMAPGKLYQN